MRRFTVERSVTWRGVGLHTGRDCTTRLNPSDGGILFRLPRSQFPARWDYVCDTSRCTVLESEGGRVSTVEHLLSAMYGAGISDAVIEVDGGEIPALDGSALPFYEPIVAAGKSRVPGSLKQLSEPTYVEQDGKFVGIALEGNSIFGHISFGPPSHLFQAGSFNMEDYSREIAPARTFVFEHEIQALRDAGLAKGGSLDNALVIGSTEYSTPQRLPNEPLRHKLLDVLGDLMLVGQPLYGVSFVAIKPGHTINVALAREVARLLDTKE